MFFHVILNRFAAGSQVICFKVFCLFLSLFVFSKLRLKAKHKYNIYIYSIYILKLNYGDVDKSQRHDRKRWHCLTPIG